MNCDELAATLEKTLIHERDTSWSHDARRHAEGCPLCARLLELHQIEVRLTLLPGVEASPLLLETVMSRIMQRSPVAAQASRGFDHEMFRYAVIAVGALVLAPAYMLPAPGASWLSNAMSSPGLVRHVGFSAYLSQHPLWAIHLAGLGAVMIVVGLFSSERPAREHI
jgi:hypothetical protein